MLDLSHGVVVREFLVAIRDLYARNRKSFSLKTLFLPVTSADILVIKFFQLFFNILQVQAALRDLSIESIGYSRT